MATNATGGGPKKPSERTFGQRYLKALELWNLVKDDAGYDPTGNDLITKKAFEAFVGRVGEANTKVADLEPGYNAAQDLRLEMYYGPTGILKRAGLIREVLGGLKGGKTSTAYVTVQKVVQEMINYRKPKKDVADGTEPKEDRSTAQTSFGSVLLKGREVLGVIKHMADAYVTGNPLVTVAAFGQLLDAAEAQDTIIGTARNQLNEAKRARLKLFEGEEGLRERVAAMKSHVAGNVEGGRKSTLYKEMVKVRYQ
jgi:hypothetical protein